MPTLPTRAKAELGVVDIALQSGVLALLEVVESLDRLIGCIHQIGLLAGGFRGGHFQRPAHAIGQGEGRLQVPSVAEVDVVVGDGALIECVREGAG